LREMQGGIKIVGEGDVERERGRETRERGIERERGGRERGII